MRRTSLQLFDLNIIEAPWKQNSSPCKCNLYLGTLLTKRLGLFLLLCFFVSWGSNVFFLTETPLHTVAMGARETKKQNRNLFFFFSLWILAITPLQTHRKCIEIFEHLLPLEKLSWDSSKFYRTLLVWSTFDFTVAFGAEKICLSLEINKLK